LHGAGDERTGGERTGRAEARAGEGFDRCANGNIVERGGRGIEAQVAPAGRAFDVASRVTHGLGVNGQRRDEFLACARLVAT
jgi:hypothetical protein